MTIQIRKATMDDFDELFELKLESREEARNFSDELRPAKEVSKHYKEYLTNDLKSEWRAVFIAVKDGKLVGLVLGKIYRTLYVAGFKRKGYISNLYVKKELRGKGIGKKLTEAIISWFKSKGATAISLEVFGNNKNAIDFYHKFGFKNQSIKMVRDI